MRENPSIVGSSKIIRRKVDGEWRYFVQVTCEHPPVLKKKNRLGQGEIGIDVGVLDVAVATDNYVGLIPFCEEIQRGLNGFRKQIRRLQRKFSRQIGPKNNPDAYDSKGVPKKGIRIRLTKRAEETKEEIADLHNRQKQLRKSLHGKMVNWLRSQGDVLKLEDVPYKAWQRIHGRGTGVGAAGMFVALAHRKFESTGGRVVEFNTRTTKCSQLCPMCGHYTTKKHPETFTCEKCSFTMQRDKCSAILALCYDESGKCIDLDAAKERAMKELTVAEVGV